MEGRGMGVGDWELPFHRLLFDGNNVGSLKRELFFRVQMMGLGMGIKCDITNCPNLTLQHPDMKVEYFVRDINNTHSSKLNFFLNWNTFIPLNWLDIITRTTSGMVSLVERSLGIV